MVGNLAATRRKIRDEDVCVSLRPNTLGKGMNPSIYSLSHPATGRGFSVGMVTGQVEGKL